MRLNPKNKGIKFENTVKKQISSGAIWFSPLDLSTDEYLIECKYTDQKGYRITKDLIEKIWTQALQKGKTPKLVIGITRNDEQIFLINCDISIKNK